MTTRLGGTGIWSSTLRYGDSGEAAALAGELEGLGYSTLWIPDVGGDLFTPLGNLLGATSTMTVRRRCPDSLEVISVFTCRVPDVCAVTKDSGGRKAAARRLDLRRQAIRPRRRHVRVDDYAFSWRNDGTRC